MRRQKRRDVELHEQRRNPDFDTVSLGDGSMRSDSESVNTPGFPPLNGMTDHRPATSGHRRSCLSDGVRDLRHLPNVRNTERSLRRLCLFTPSSASSARRL